MKCIKKIRSFLGITAIGVSVLNGQAQNCLSFASEHAPDFSNTVREVATATTSIGQFQANVKVNGQPLSILAAQIKTTALCALRDDALDVLAHLTPAQSCNGYMTAMKITYGMTGNTMQYYYQPVLLCYSATTTDEGICFNSYTVHYSGKYYTYIDNSADFTPVTGDAATTVANSARIYTASVRIVHYSGQAPSGWKAATSETDVLADPEGIIYTFREIKMAASENSTETIKLWNSNQVIPATLPDGTGVVLNKHSLIISGGNSNGITTLLKGKEKYFGFDGVITDKSKGLLAAYRNLAHLCPPNCLKTTFRISCD